MKANRIQVFEYTSLFIDNDYKGVMFQKQHYKALIKLNEFHKGKYFNILHNGIGFKQFVGVIQIDELIIEILPKIDNAKGTKNQWQNVLIEMLRVTKKLKVQKVGEADVKKQQIHLLDIYFEWFLNEVQLLIRQGLIKQYYKQTGNVKSLKGRLEFAGQIKKNLVHKERFWTTHQIYDKDHLIHQVLSQAMFIIEMLSKGTYLHSRCKTAWFDFPEVKKISATEHTFLNIPKYRKTMPYDTALAIARLIILNYAPNVSSGSERMFALLFDMNSLWEEYVTIRLKQAAINFSGVTVQGQSSKSFWNGISIRPDIVVSIEKLSQQFIIDAKWKHVGRGNASMDDLRQMYVYNDYWNSNRAVLLYPGIDSVPPDFIAFSSLPGKTSHHFCGIGQINIFSKDNVLDEMVGARLLQWFDIG
ncbi:restriction endonuclease [Flavobacterium sp. BFFFF1]|uniref:McrC family protein n=1 Tax=Flavobacterium sp. BFFFF1 TaxID=2015557 RepID=UPI0025BC4420|nr:restriction endonuclease [Flavobacterium sp. BFFFF1]